MARVEEVVQRQEVDRDSQTICWIILHTYHILATLMLFNFFMYQVDTINKSFTRLVRLRMRPYLCCTARAQWLAAGLAQMFACSLLDSIARYKSSWFAGTVVSFRQRYIAVATDRKQLVEVMTTSQMLWSTLVLGCSLLVQLASCCSGGDKVRVSFAFKLCKWVCVCMRQ